MGQQVIDQVLPGFGAVALIGILSAWLGKVWASRILQEDRVKYETQMQTLLQDLRTRGSKVVFVHQLQFEKEFEVYLHLWRELRRACLAAIRFRDIKFASNKSHHEELQDLQKATNLTIGWVHDYRPFYDPHIFEDVKLLIGNLRIVYWNESDTRMAERRSDETNKLLDETIASVPRICEKIRSRIFPIHAAVNK